MLEEHTKRDKMHIINLISRRSNDTPNFALLIGAGASASSGVKTASHMIDEWRRQLYDESKSNEPFEEWLPKQDWYQDDEEYSILFEKVCDQRSQRRTCIEESVKDAKPSWGYIYLANIIANNYFNVIFTPNFDDLLNEACFLYADLRALVCAHDSAVADVRVTSARPKIIKLHGDYLYDSIKNTVRETETLEKNMRDKFIQFAREYGLVVVGYGGSDRSIMDILDTMLRSEGHFPNGLYWCIRKEDKVSRKLERLMRRDNAYWVTIDDFDAFIAELHEGLGLTLPDTVRDPYKATTARLNTFILPVEEVDHPIIKRDVAELEEQVKTFERLISGKIPKEEFDRLVPYRFLGDMEYAGNNYEQALLYYEKALVQNTGDLDMMRKTVLSYIRTEEVDKASQISEQMINQAPTDYRGYFYKGSSLARLNRLSDAITNFNKALKYTAPQSTARVFVFVTRSNVHLKGGNWQKALADAEEALKIAPQSDAAAVNKSLALKRLKREKEAKQTLTDVLSRTKNKYYRACAFATLGDKKKMLKELEAAIEKDSASRVDAKFDPDFADYREDADFRKLVYEGQVQEEKL